MSQYFSNIHSLRVEMDGGDQAVVIACNIEYIKFPDLVHAVEAPLQLSIRVKSAFLDILPPILQRLVRMRVCLREQFQGFVADYPHDFNKLCI